LNTASDALIHHTILEDALYIVAAGSNIKRLVLKLPPYYFDKQDTRFPDAFDLFIQPINQALGFEGTVYKIEKAEAWAWERDDGTKLVWTRK